MVFLQPGGQGLSRVAIVLLAGALAPAFAQNANPGISPKDLALQNSGIVAPMQPPAPAATTLSIGSSLTDIEGLPVVNVDFRGIQVDPPVMADLRKMVAPVEGKPLERQTVGKILRDLYATGRFADIQVEAQKDQKNEVSLVFVATENLFIGEVTVDGAPKRPTPSQLIDASKLELGEAYDPVKVEQGIARMKQVLADNGYYRAVVNVDVQKNPNIQRASLQFHVVPGPAATIGKIVIEGDSGLTDAEVLKITKLRPQQTASMQKLTSALQRLRKKFTKRNQLEAQIAVVKKDYHAETNDLDYTIRINRGPVIDIRVEGASLSKRQLQRYVPVYEEHAIDDDLLNEGRRNIRDYLQSKGFFDATVDYKRVREQDENRVAITYDVDRSKRHDLEELVIAGNKIFDTSLIKERMSVQKASWLMRHGRFSQELLARDVENVKALYLSNGFLQVKVTGDFQDNYRGHAGHMAVFLHIEEGPQTLVTKVAIERNKAIPDQQLTPLLTMQEGQAYSEVNVLTDRDTVLNYYFNHGFPDATFTPKATPVEGDPTKMAVEYTVDEGPQVFVDRVLLSGLEFTKRGIVTRQFDIHSGDPLSQSSMLDTQRHLYDLGVFNAVEMAVQNPEGKARYKDLFFQFEEAKRWTFNYGFGIEIQPGTGGPSASPQGETSVSPRVSLEITRNNVGGRAHTLTFKSHVGSLQQLGLISYDAPRFLRNENLRLTLSAFYNNSLDVRTFTSQRLEGSVQVEQVVSRTQTHIPVTTLLYRFTYRRVRASDVVVSPSLIPLYSLPVRVGMPSLTFIRDHRDDPIETHRGSFNTFDTGVASGTFGSEAAFGRFNGQNSTYYQFHVKRWVFARNTRLGVAEPFGDTHQLPLPERFFAGGASSHRGFAINQAGPRDLTTGQPLGGNAVFVNSFELRTPPLVMPFVADNMSLALFHDMGNVFNTVNDMFHSVVRFTQPHRELCTEAATASQCEFNYISHAMGLGLRYKTPVGPVRLDFGYNLNPPVFPVFTTDPTTNITTFSSQTLRHFNFFFSIGQTF
jgi:outer membrane protein insertion porin family